MNRQALALSPIFLFLAIFLGSGFYLQSQGVEFAFYQLPAPVAILPAIVLAVLLSKVSLNKTIEQFVGGVGQPDIITMCLIYLMAGAFSAVASATGGVEAVVSLGIDWIPPSLLLPGLFVLSAFIATAMGTSMGTLAAMAPIGLGLAQAGDIPLPLIAGVLLSGAMFGDNLSIISDTTIAATRTQGAAMKDKFVANIKMAAPAAIIALLVFSFGFDVNVSDAQLDNTQAGSSWLALPYIAILILAVSGVNVFVVLSVGIVLSVLFGATVSDYEIGGLGADLYKGFGNMQEIFLLSLLIGGLSELMRQQGGLDFLVRAIMKVCNGIAKGKQRTYSLAIACLSALTNLCVANNTVAIILSGQAAKKLAQEANIKPKKSASLLDIFSCVVQGLLPYGAQALLLSGALSISPTAIAPYVVYCWVLAVFAVGFVLFSPNEG